MLTELAVDNFKAFRGRHRVPLAPITLIFGGNSAGKSSLIQALLLLKQTLVGSGGAAFGPRGSDSLVVRGDLVDLGSFRALIHAHDTRLALGLGVGARMPMRSGTPGRTPGRYRPSPHSGPLMTLEFEHLEDEHGFESDITQTAIRIAADNGEISTRSHPTAADVFPDTVGIGGRSTVDLSLEDAATLLEWAAHAAAAQGIAPARDDLGFGRSAFLTLRGGLPIEIGVSDDELGGDTTTERRRLRQNLRISENLRRNCAQAELLHDRQTASLAAAMASETATQEEIQALRDAIDATRGQLESLYRQIENHRAGPAELASDMLGDATMAVRVVLRELQYLGPFRAAPERFNILTGERVIEVGTRGQNVVDLLARSPRLLVDANRWLQQLEIPYQLEVRAITDQGAAGAIGDVHCLLLQDVRTGVEVSPADVGFGIGQVLPVVIGALTMPGVLCIEQPEIHLHPALQSKLAELFVDARIRGPHGETERQFILETHSEHMILRFQQLIRHGRLAPDDLCVLHVGFDDGGESKVQRLRLNENGEFIDPWPGGFFDERFDLIFGD